MSSTVTENDNLILKDIGPTEIASRGRRLWGHLITRLICVALILLLALVLDYFNVAALQAITISALLVLCVHFLVIYFKHQTIGMIVVRTKIVSDGIKPFSIRKVILWRLLLEWIFPFIPVLGLASFFNYLNITGNSTNRCIHDELSNSIVVKTQT